VILAWLSLCVVGGLCFGPCGRFVCCQGLGRAWQVLGIMSGAVESNNKYFKISVYPHFKIVPKCMQRLENEAQDDKQKYTNQSKINKNETVGVLGCLRDARRLQDHEKGAGP
jgi:hypothetical protein